MLDPECPVLIEGGDTLLGRHKRGAALLGGRLNEISDRSFGLPILPGRYGISRLTRRDPSYQESRPRLAPLSASQVHVAMPRLLSAFFAAQRQLALPELLASVTRLLGFLDLFDNLGQIVGGRLLQRRVLNIR